MPHTVPSSLPISAHGFILTRTVKEHLGKTLLEIWLTTDRGPMQLITEPQRYVCFIAQPQVHRAERKLRSEEINFESTNLPLKTFQHESVTAFYFKTNSLFFKAKEALKNEAITSFEDDIRLTERFLMERFVYGGVAFLGKPSNQTQAAHTGAYQTLTQAKVKPADYVPTFRVISLDIECGKNSHLYSVGLAATDFEAVIMIGAPKPKDEPAPKYIYWVENEKALLLKLVELIQQYDPDIFIGWSVVQFDFNLLIKRAAANHVPLTLGRDGSAISWKESRTPGAPGFVNMVGRLIIDGIDALKTATYQFDSFSLEHVSQTLLGKGKAIESVQNRFEHIQHDFIHNKVKLAKYNLQDCVLVNEIFEKTELMDFLILRSQLTGLELDRSGGSVAAFLNLYLPKLHRAGYVSPNRPEGGGLASPGGYVMNSKPGLYKNVLVLDFKSLYPSIIRTFKIDPMGLIEGLAKPDNAIPGFKGALFDRRKHFLPDIITSLWKQRDQAKKNKQSARSQAIKILMNSFYGVLGSGGCPFYDTRLASSITMRGHEIMQTTADWICEKGFDVIYGDTDSTFVWIGNECTNSQADEIGADLAQTINQKWQHMIDDKFDLESCLEIEFETHFERFLMPTIRGSELGSKKRYCGIKRGKQGTEMVFKGLETVRSDWTDLAKTFQQTLYEKVFNDEDVTDYLIDLVNAIREGLHDNALIYKKQLRQPLANYQKNVPPHVKAARLADEKNAQLGLPLQYQHKGWIHYVITLQGPEPVDFQEHAFDYEHYIEKQIKPIAEGILPFIGLSFDDITNQQMGLF